MTIRRLIGALMRRGFFLVVVFVLLAGLAGGLAWFQLVFKPEMIRGFIAKAPQPVSSVAVEAAREETWRSRLPAIGTFRAVKGVEVASQVGGVLVTIGFESGQEVRKGDTIAQIDDSVEQADLKANQANLKNTELALERQRTLVGGGSTTKAALDAATAARDSSAAAVERTRALINQKKLVAPFDGRLGLRRVDIGQYLSPGAPIVNLQQLDPMYVDFPLPEQSFGLLREGLEVEVQADAYPGETFRGKVASIDARVAVETRNVLVRAEIENSQRRLRPGMFGNVDVLAGEPRTVITAPRTAVTFSLYGNAVYAVAPAPAAAGAAQAGGEQEQLVVERRFVRTGAAKGDRIEILEGVKPGDRLIVEGQIKLQPGGRVRIAPQGATQSPPSVLPKE
ncbi:MAG: efflux transporter, family, subunit [Hyphomicrobiales bacterium]|nr:efflux transporter, family, subunit [Hyphomicrobiales bacterium]